MTHQFLCNCYKKEASTQRFFDFKGEGDAASEIDEKRAERVRRYVEKDFKKLLGCREFEELQENTDDKRDQMPQLRHSQVELGKVLGRGAFSNVFEVKKFHSNDAGVQADGVAIKMLRRRVTEDPESFALAAAGLAREGAILASLSHKNVIHMKAFSQAGLSAYASGRSDAFFLVLDRLEVTLSERIKAWVETKRRLKFAIQHRREGFRSFFRERLLVAADLADALTYLHHKNILHRDIKPSNVGFDGDGTLKLFDFDVARILPKEISKDELFLLSLATGTERYMSPENALIGKYNLKSDVYSFAIVLHEVLALERPFSSLTKAEFRELVLREGHRPRIHESWPEPIRDLLQAAWSSDIKCRPSMERVCKILGEEIKGLEHPPATRGSKFRVPFRALTKTAPVGIYAH